MRYLTSDIRTIRNGNFVYISQPLVSFISMSMENVTMCKIFYAQHVI